MLLQLDVIFGLSATMNTHSYRQASIDIINNYGLNYGSRNYQSDRPHKELISMGDRGMTPLN
ncbi:hypothetical protein [Microcoleus sp. Pol8_C1]|uniref:hypothetical protein n=1 Tax=Microcoleus sp. Pol8_C1 TaxID=2818896 RepID=UPI002FD3D960